MLNKIIEYCFISVLFDRVRGYFERRSAAKAADALYHFMVLNGHKINDDEYDTLCRVRGSLLKRS